MAVRRCRAGFGMTVKSLETGLFRTADKILPATTFVALQRANPKLGTKIMICTAIAPKLQDAAARPVRDGGSQAMNLQGNPDESVAELLSLRANGPWNLAAISPEGGPPEFISFKGSGQVTAMRDWIAERDGAANLYWTPNPTRRRMNRKPKKGDMGRGDFAYVDCDPLPGEPPAEAKQRHREALEDLPTPPTTIIDTGNGLCALLKLKDPVVFAPGDMDAIARYEAINVGLVQALGGKAKGVDPCHSAEHLMRLPHTVNIPNAKKRAAGRVPVVAGDVEHFPERVYELAELPTASAPNVASEPLSPIGAPEAVDVEDLPIAEKFKDMIREGAPVGRRSEAIYSVVRAMYSAKEPKEATLGILTDDRYGISEKFHERDDPEGAARREIMRIISKAKAELAQEFAEPVETDHLPDTAEPVKPRKLITPTPYVWTDPTKIPPREWAYKPFYIRKFAGSTVATGGAGKSSLLLVESVAMASGKNLLGVQPEPGLKVWYWNGEDPLDELQRRVQAILKHYKVTAADIEGRLFVDSGRDTVIRIAELQDGKTRIAVPIVNRMIEVIRGLALDVIIIDPFVSSHGVPENDNNAIDQVAKKWADIADKTNTHVHISHHTRKTNGMSATAEDSRGASSLHNAMRTRRAISTMTGSEAEKAGIVGNARLSYLKADTAGSSMTKPAEAMESYRFESVQLNNGREFGSDGDEVGVVVKWEYKTPGIGDLSDDDANVALAALEIGGPWRLDPQAGKKWAGEAVAEALHLDAEGDRKLIKRYLKEWLDKAYLERYAAADQHRKMKVCIRPMDFN
jgi:hypothetical protein